MMYTRKQDGTALGDLIEISCALMLALLILWAML